MTIPVLEKHWSCPNCKTQAVTHDSATPFHACKGLSGLSVALVPAGAKVRVSLVERGDYIGAEQGIRMHKGRPIMATKIERPDGSYDSTVYAPMASVGVEN